MSSVSTVILYTVVDAKLKKAVESVLWCNEVILLGDAPHKNTRYPGEKDGRVRWVKKPFPRNFAEQRNFGLSLAKKKWVLFLDSDEIISPDLRDEMLSAVERDDIVGYFVKRQDVFMGRILRHGEPSQVALLRLARKDAGEWKRPVHEYWAVKGKTDILTNPLYHDPHASVSAFLGKIDLYTTLEAEYRKSMGVPFSLLECLVYPVVKFLQNYVFRLGMLDGFPGLAMAYIMSMHSCIVRIKMYETR